MFIYLISDRDRVFKLNGFLYKTPCRIGVKPGRELDQLILAIKQNKLKKVKVENQTNIKYHNKIQKQPISGVSNKIALSTGIGNKSSSITL